jgi:hypothetical protein
MATKFDDTNKIIDEIQDVLDRTYWTIEIPKYPTKLQRFLSRLFFKTEFRKIIKSKNDT